MKLYEASISYNCVGDVKINSCSSPQEVIAYMDEVVDDYPMQEQCWVILLNRKNKPLGRAMISLGTANNSLIHPREVFKPAILASASAVILIHNHPSGDPAPSVADIKITRTMKEAGKIIGINLLDHVIVGDKGENPDGFYSFSEAGLI